MEEGGSGEKDWGGGAGCWEAIGQKRIVTIIEYDEIGGLLHEIPQEHCAGLAELNMDCERALSNLRKALSSYTAYNGHLRDFRQRSFEASSDGYTHD